MRSPLIARCQLGRRGALTNLYVSDTARTGRGLFTAASIAQGDEAFELTGIERLDRERSLATAQENPNWFGIGRDRWLDPDHPFMFLNHSCEPNLGIRGEREFVALRDIPAGAELTVDYAITENNPYWEMRCSCGEARCRETIRAIQFLPAEIFARYLPLIGDHFVAEWRAHNLCLGSSRFSPDPNVLSRAR